MEKCLLEFVEQKINKRKGTNINENTSCLESLLIIGLREDLKVCSNIFLFLFFSDFSLLDVAVLF